MRRSSTHSIICEHIGVREEGHVSQRDRQTNYRLVVPRLRTAPQTSAPQLAATSGVRSSMFWRSGVTLNHKFEQWRMFSIATGLNRFKTLRKQFTTSFYITRKPWLRQSLFCVEIHIRFRPPLLMETLHKYLKYNMCAFVLYPSK